MEKRMNANSFTRLIGAFILGSVLTAGCGRGSGAGTADTTAHTSSEAVPAPAETTASSEVKSYVFHGTPTAIDSAAGTITVRHEKVEGLAPEGTDTYTVADPAILADAKVGTETHLTLRVAGGKSLVTKVQAGHDKGTEH
jgi:Cu/Ag efflux protein CusF